MALPQSLPGGSPGTGVWSLNWGNRMVILSLALYLMMDKVRFPYVLPTQTVRLRFLERVRTLEVRRLLRP